MSDLIAQAKPACAKYVEGKDGMAQLRIGLIIGSTRTNRFADVAADWMMASAAARTDLRLEVLDLRSQNLPFLDEPTAPAFTGGVFARPEAEAWRARLAPLDGFIATVAEYNHGPTAVLKNALDSAYLEWHRKPIAFVGYGGAGGLRAIQQLRAIVIGLQMAPLKQDVSISMEAFLAARDGAPLEDYAHLVQARQALFDSLIWWASALKAARAA